MRFCHSHSFVKRLIQQTIKQWLHSVLPHCTDLCEHVQEPNVEINLQLVRKNQVDVNNYHITNDISNCWDAKSFLI